MNVYSADCTIKKFPLYYLTPISAIVFESIRSRVNMCASIFSSVR